jgi:hypothetical protein
MILGVVVSGLTFYFTDEEISLTNIITGVLFWPFGVIYFLVKLVCKIAYELGI